MSETNTANETLSPTGWWSRPGGGREVLSVAAPLVVSSLSWTVMTFVDRMFLNHWSGAAMAAAFVASMIWFAALCLPLGICSYTSTFVAQYHGSAQPRRIGPAVWQGVWFALAASPFLLAAIPFADAIFLAAGHAPSDVELEGRYFAILCYGAPGMLLAQSLSSFYSGRGKTVVVMIVDSVFAILNVLLDWWWIFGLTVAWGDETLEVFPAWGIAGAGWATVTATWLKAATYLLIFVLPRYRAEFGTGHAIFDVKLFRRLLYFGGPAGVQMLLDVLGFTVFVVLVGRLGSVENEATSLTFSISSLAFMPVFGIGLAVSILVGQHLGEDRDRVAAQATWTALHVSWAYMALVSIGLVFFPQLFLSGFFAGEPMSGDLTTRAAVESTALVLLRFVAAYNFLDAMAIVFVSALKGAGDTRFILLTSLVMALALGLLTWLMVDVAHAGLYGCWGVISAWVGTIGMVFLLRFLNGSWRSMRVIEPKLVEPESDAGEFA
ncbi:Multidrug resistance protein NorM [Botrimarina colliarenosi]|uniref:Multidrug-efflux transporter n=1 Tax=Botrimarina colliarenosi TaxID=2528001 RepID=A0A5C6AJV1_9BACT|nr:MATE family efflux transporter [Botrimarina colliarenosi]TWT99909.1 Multidrug resistance protein NorM [Botrimarina colliarenosi]